jgi:hypothetical protein
VCPFQYEGQLVPSSACADVDNNSLREPSGAPNVRRKISLREVLGMRTKPELEAKGPAELAMLCQDVADNPSAYSNSISSNAHQLIMEWQPLQTRSDPDYEKQKKIEAQKIALKNRMAEFLSAIL